MSNELESRFEKIEEHANKDKAALTFVNNLIVQNQAEFTEVFSGQDNDILSDSELFDKVKQTIKTMQMEALRTTGTIFK